MTQDRHTEDAAFAVGAFAACHHYAAAEAEPGGPCEWCGWLEADHEALIAVAEVHTLPVAPRTRRPARRAS
jgi:hypothetical protein